jgi:hypothetical protein
MQKIPADHRSVVEKRFPRFVKAVKSARSTHGLPVYTSLSDFVPEDMTSVYACLWYAHSEGVDVTFTAHPKTP